MIIQILLCCWPDNLGSFAEWCTFLITAIGLMSAGCEYDNHKKEMRTQLLLEYNKRYMEDSAVRKVVDYIVNPQQTKSEDKKIPTLFEKELFMRFFEELYLLIDDKQLPVDKVHYMFAYYVLEFDKNYNLREDVKDYPQDDKSKDWKYYFKFVQKMKEYEKVNKYNRS